MNAGNIALVVASLLLGWLALLPARNALGALGYHLFAIPVGLVIWPVVGAITTAMRVPFSGRLVLPVSIAVAGAIAVGILAFERFAGGPAEKAKRRVSGVSYLITAAAVMVPTAALDALGLTEGNYDSVFHYYSWGVWLRDTGDFTNASAGANGFGLPALSAVTMVFGGQWTFVIYSILGIIVACLTAWALFDALPRELSVRMRSTITGVAVAIMVTTPMYLYSLYHVHSQMISAMYLTLGVLAVIRAFGIPGSIGLAHRADDPDSAREPQASPSWLVVAGLSCAGLAFARVDGLAYQIIILLVATAAAFASGMRGKGLAPLFASALTVEIGTYALVAWRIRLWKSASKLSGRMAFALMGAIAIYAIAVMVAARFEPVSEWLSSPRRFFALVGGGSAVAVALLWLRAPAGFATTVNNQVTNLTRTGSWGYLWFFLFGAAVLSLVFWRARRAEDVASYVLFAVFEFAVVALAVHGTSHSGRISPYDSFNRVVFHVVPLLFIYIGLFAGGLTRTLRIEARA